MVTVATILGRARESLTRQSMTSALEGVGYFMPPPPHIHIWEARHTWYQIQPQNSSKRDK